MGVAGRHVEVEFAVCPVQLGGNVTQTYAAVAVEAAGSYLLEQAACPMFELPEEV